MLTHFTFVALVIISSMNGLSSAKPETSPENMPVEIREMHVSSTIRYRYCRTQVVSSVVNTNPFKAQEINFFIRIPRNAFISNFTLNTENETYPARVVKREEASSMYGTAIDYSHNAALIEMDRDSKMFNVSLNIEAKGELVFVVIYEEQIVRENGHYAYRIYMHPQQMKIVKDFTVQINMKEFYPIKYISIPNIKTENTILELHEAEQKINGSTASVDWLPRRNKTQYEQLVSQGALGEFTIHYDLIRDSRPGQILLRNGYFVHTFNTQDLPILPKHVIFVLDISASMEGLRLQQLQSAMKNIFDDLRADDYFNIITFSSQVKNWSPFSGTCSQEVVPCSRDFKNIAIDFIENLKVHGSTNINGALEEALRLPRKFRSIQSKRCILPKEYDKYMQSNITSMILFLTDGEPTSGFINRPEILRNIKIRNSKQIPIFSLAFGAEADFNFVQKLSLQNHGFSRRVYEGIDSDIQLEKFYEKISSPVLSNVTFLYTSPIYNISKITFHRFSMINKDSEIQITGEITPTYDVSTFQKISSSNVTENTTAQSITDIFKVSAPKYLDASIICYCDFCENRREEFISADTLYNPSNECHDEEDYFMERRWAYLSIMNLIDMQKSQENATITEKIVNMSIKYQFVTPYTSLVVVKPSRDHTETSTINVDAEIDDPLEKNKNSAAFHQGPSTTKRPRKFVTLLSAPVPNFTPGPISAQIQKHAPEFDSNLYPSKGFSLLKMSSSVIKNHDTSAGKRLNLTDILWLENHKSILFRSEVYSFSQNHQGKISYQNCQVPRNRPGRCKHLKDCIVKEILTDFNLFLSSYFCPISSQNGKFIGTCCQEPDMLLRS